MADPVQHLDADATRSDASGRSNSVGHYRLIEIIGKGGMGDVYKAEHLHLGNLVAVKVLPEDRAQDADLLARFLNEMKAIGRLRHVNLVSATDAGVASGRYFIAMELLDGLNLSKISTHMGKLPIADACELACQAARGLECLHADGLLHRDVKPSNLFLTADGVVKVLDLGLAQLKNRPASEEPLTQMGMVLGTGDFMAPEQYEDAHSVDARADIYSLGCTLYKFLTGKAPFEGPRHNTLPKKMLAHQYTPLPPISGHRPDLPSDLGRFVDRMLAKSADDRPATCAEIVAELAPFTQGANLKALLAQTLIKEKASIPIPAPTVLEETRDRSREPTDTASPAAIPVSLKRSKRWWIILGVGTMAIGLAIGTIAISLPPSANPVVQDPAIDKKVAENKQDPSGWQYLLAQKPTEILWPKASLNAQYAHDDKKNEILVFTDQTSLLGMSKCDSLSYRLQVGIYQIDWKGGVGVFLGFHEAAHNGKAIRHYQTLVLRPYLSNDPKRAFQICRTKHDSDTRPITSHPLEHPGNSEQTLDLIVRRGRLSEVRWNGLLLGNLTKPEYNDAFPPVYYTGPIGIYVDRSQAKFLNARYFHLSEE